MGFVLQMFGNNVAHFFPYLLYLIVTYVMPSLHCQLLFKWITCYNWLSTFKKRQWQLHERNCFNQNVPNLVQLSFPRRCLMYINLTFKAISAFSSYRVQGVESGYAKMSHTCNNSVCDTYARCKPEACLHSIFVLHISTFSIASNQSGTMR